MAEPITSNLAQRTRFSILNKYSIWYEVVIIVRTRDQSELTHSNARDSCMGAKWVVIPLTAVLEFQALVSMATDIHLSVIPARAKIQ